MRQEKLMENDLQADQELDIRRFQSEDAQGVVRLFQSVYGNAYPVAAYLDPQLLIAENAAQRIISSVARTATGDIIGHTALFNSAPHPGTYESGAGVVHAGYRGGKGVFSRLVAHGLELAAGLPDVDMVFGEPVCNHMFTQKMSIDRGFVSRALEVDLMPAAAYEKEASAKGRVAAFLDFFSCTRRPHAVYLPEVYKEQCIYLYQDLDDERDMFFVDAEDGDAAATVMHEQIFDFAAVARVAIYAAGADFSSRLEALENELLAKGVLVIQIWLKLAGPWVGGVIRILRENGYFLGGVLPRWFNDDGLLMQKIGKRPDWEGICAYNDRYKKILEMVRNDWERTNKENFHGD